MKNKKINGKYVFIFLSFLLLLSPVLISYFSVPNVVKVTVGKENKLDFNVPFQKPMYVKKDEVGTEEMTVSWMGIVPIKTVSLEVLPGKEVIPSGEVVGVRLYADGIYVLGTSEVETEQGMVKPCKDTLKKGDIIHSFNEVTLESKEHFKKLVEANGEKMIQLGVERKDETLTLQVEPVYSSNEGAYKLGVWVKDGTQGIGTITYIDPEDDSFGALGHGITDGEIKKLIPIREATLTKTTLTSITKGMIGTPGQLSGTIEGTAKNTIGSVTSNTSLGIYGTLNTNGKSYLEGQPMPIAFQHEVHEGDAKVMVHLVGNEPQLYDIAIEKVTKYTSEPSKGMVIRIIDPKLLRLTNGIVQGMSGSPIIQDGKLIGAVTHVFVQDPAKGYGIFIENMLNNEFK